MDNAETKNGRQALIKGNTNTDKNEFCQSYIKLGQTLKTQIILMRVFSNVSYLFYFLSYISVLYHNAMY